MAENLSTTFSTLEFVLSIPHINDYIFDLIDIPQVLQCRLVSKRWKEMVDGNRRIFWARIMGEVGDQILELIDIPQLLQCRLVSKSWRDSAERILVKRPIEDSLWPIPLPQPITKWQKGKKNCRVTHEVMRDYDISRLRYAIFNSLKLPGDMMRNFEMIGYHKLSELDPRFFIAIHGIAASVQKFEFELNVQAGSRRVSLLKKTKIKYKFFSKK